MKKALFWILTLAVICVIVFLAVNRTPDESLSADSKLSEIISDGGCASCHSSDPKLPAYAEWPLVGKMIHRHSSNGYQAFDIEPVLKALADSAQVNDVDLAKVEKVIYDRSMPPLSYSAVHWKSFVTRAEKESASSAFAHLRSEYYPDNLASAEFSNEPVRPIPDSIPVDNRKVQLGFKLYHDMRLSVDNTVSCASCHGLDTAGVDNERLSAGVYNQYGTANAPTTYNSAFNFVQFWDGRAATLAAQASGPVLNPVEMGSKSFDDVVAKLRADKPFAASFDAVYPQGLSEAAITDAIAEYEKTLITPNSAFDRYLKGDRQAMTPEEIKGYSLFKKYDCATCHAGVALGGQSYDRIDSSYFADRHKPMTAADLGRYSQTKMARDRYRFKTPGLRNVELTFPYFHDGYVLSLDDAVVKMGKYELDTSIPRDDVKDMVAFLKTLTGEYQGKKLTNPKMSRPKD